jgi:hypothetical protein
MECGNQQHRALSLQIDFAQIDPILPLSILPPSILDRNSGREVLEPVRLILRLAGL